ncbi:hypothetical protein EMCG_04596 [[Emmonsia] crescens]|uniref:Uncharacterized protein n=1 Tax=[Emmonsia] crescens TaxID=73230 RepID=A0A0G2HRK2_9EURO|nr:hypothetical protein EMCG_04596 [Emmonsia crescens UAMH 3008]
MSNQGALSSQPQQPQQPQQAQGQSERYRVFRLLLDTVAHDPLDPPKRYHEGIFVETNPENGKGTLFHVTGDIIAANGMRYEEKSSYTPTLSQYLHKSEQIGWIIPAHFHSKRISAILENLPTPSKQQGINFWEPDPDTGLHPIIWTKENGDRYGPGEKRRPIIKCNEWTNLTAIPALRTAGVLHDLA